MANCFKRLNALSLKVYTRLSSFFHKMYDFNPVTRVIDIDLLLSEYENILLETGILIRIGKSFEKNILVNKPPAPLDIIKEAKSDEQSVPEHLSNILQEYANKDAVETLVREKSRTKTMSKTRSKSKSKSKTRSKSKTQRNRKGTKHTYPPNDMAYWRGLFFSRGI